MTKITQIEDRGSAVAWCPIPSHPDVIALGSKDSGGVGFDDHGGDLELWDWNLTGSEKKPIVVGSVKTAARFASIGWSSKPLVGYPMGIIAGGMIDGTVLVFDPNAMMQGKEDAIICTIEGHGHGAVKAVQFSSLEPHMLATGGSDGQVLITDLSDPKQPVKSSPSGETGATKEPEVTQLAWNTQVAHILASADNSGLVTVWDLNQKKKWCELRADGVAVSGMAWNPSQGLHLVTGSVDDRNPVLKVWDLQTSTTMPLATLTGHSHGVLSLSWCPHDDALLLSCGKDNRTILWDLYTLQAIADLPNDEPMSAEDVSATQPSQLFGAGGLNSSQQKRYDVQWSPLKRGVVSTCSFDRKVQAHSMNGLATRSGRAPKWFKPNSGVSCGFGGQVISFGSTDKVVRMNTIVEQPSLLIASRQFETAFADHSVIDFCQKMAADGSGDDDEQQIWSFMQVIFATNARAQLLGHLGFDPERIKEAAMAYEEMKSPDHTEATNGHSTRLSQAAEETIKKALVVGNFEAAVECCIRSANMADALILASCGEPDLWAKTQQRYFASEAKKRPFLSIVGAVITNQMDDLVAKSNTDNWEETLAILSTYAVSEQFPSLCIALGDRLEGAGDARSACICYMCASSISNAVKYWKSKLEEANQDFLDLIALHSFVVKVSVFLKGLGSNVDLSTDIEDLFSAYAKALSDQGELVTAAKYSRGSSVDTQVLRDRLYRSRDSHYCLQSMGAAPDFPYTMVQVKKGAPRSTQQHSRQVQLSPLPTSTLSQQKTEAAPAAAVTQPTRSSQAHQLPPGWIALQDPSSGNTYYANQTTGETTWEKPQPAPAPVALAVASMSSQSAAPFSVQQSAARPLETQPSTQQTANSTSTNGTPSRQTTLVSKYGDGFVTSSSHPELGAQYGNVGTSNPYAADRPGIALVNDKKAPVSGTFNPSAIPDLAGSQQPIKEGLLEVVGMLEAKPLTSGDKKQLSEAQKGIAILLKRMARGDIDNVVAGKVLNIVTALRSSDFSTAATIQTGLVNTDWRNHKDWLKGIKNLIQLTTKKLYR